MKTRCSLFSPTLSIMIRQVHQCILMGLAVTVLSAGALDPSWPSLSVSCRMLALVDLIKLKCETPSDPDPQCFFTINPLNTPRATINPLNTPRASINLTHSQRCELHEVGAMLLKAAAASTPQLGEVWTKLEVSCTVVNGSEHSESKPETIIVWRIDLPMSHIVLGLTGFGCLILLTWVCLCIVCVLHVPIKGCDKASPHDEPKDGNEVAEDELCYATVIHPGVSESSIHTLRFDQKSEYAEVVLKSN